MKKILSLLFTFMAAMVVSAQTVSYDFSAIEGFSEWTSTYEKHVVTYDDATVTFASANSQSSTVTGIPVTKGRDVTVVLSDDTKAISSLTFTCTQWGTKAQTITLYVSKDGGENYSATKTTSSDFTLEASELEEGVNAVMFAFSSTSNQVGIASLSMTLGENNNGGSETVAAESVAITDAAGNDVGYSVSLKQGETFQLKAVVSPSNATNKKVTWEVMQDSEVISLDESGVVKALAPGKAAVVVTTDDGDYQDFVYIYVAEPEASTIADFIASKGGACYLTGVVSDIVMDKKDATKQNVYGNFNLTDATGTIYVYGCLTAAGEAKKFDTLGVSEGDKITVLATQYKQYGETDEAIDVRFVENHGAPAAPVTFEVEAGEKEFTVTPSDLDAQYYIELVPAEYDVETITSIFDSQFADMGSHLEYFSGVQTQSYEDDWYIDEAGSYLIAVCAVDENYMRVGDVVVKPFTYNPSAPAFTIVASADAETISIEPSDEESTYFYALLDKATVDYWTGIGINTNELLLTAYMDMNDIESNDDLYQGAVSAATADLGLEDGDYVFIVGGVKFDGDEKVFTTEAQRFDFTLGGGVDPVDPDPVTFALEANDLDVTITPSDEEATYSYAVLTDEIREALKIEDDATAYDALINMFNVLTSGEQTFNVMEDYLEFVGLEELEAGTELTILVAECKRDEDKKIVRTGEITTLTFTYGEEPAPAFTIVASADAETISVEPSDEESTYFYALLDKATVDYWTGIGINTNELLLTAYMDMSDIVSNDDLYQGAVSAATADLGLEDGDYVFIVGGVKFDGDEKVFTTEAQRFDFTLGGGEGPDNPDVVTFDVKADGLNVTITPSDEEATYAYAVVIDEIKEAIGSEDNAELFDILVENFNKLTTGTVTFDMLEDYLEYLGLEELPVGTEVTVLVAECKRGEDTQIVRTGEMKALTFEVQMSVGINGIAAQQSSATTYNLAGQRVKANQKGIVIKDGKKYLVK